MLRGNSVLETLTRERQDKHLQNQKNRKKDADCGGCVGSDKSDGIIVKCEKVAKSRGEDKIVSQLSSGKAVELKRTE